MYYRNVFNKRADQGLRMGLCSASFSLGRQLINKQPHLLTQSHMYGQLTLAQLAQYIHETVAAKLDGDMAPESHTIS